MTEKDILNQIRSECRNASPDNFKKIEKSIMSDLDTAEVIHKSTNVRNIFIKCTAAAAALVLPVSVIAYAGRADLISRNSREADLSPVTQITYETVFNSEKAEQTASFTTSVSETTVPETEKTEISESSETLQQPVTKEMVINIYEPEIPETEPAYSENKEIQTEPDVTEYSETTESPETTAFSETEPVQETESPEEAEPFKTELQLVPGYSDKIFCIERKSPVSEDSFRIYHGESGDYKIISPDSYTVYVYDVIIYGYDYFDFLKKGDYVFKAETEYTIDELLNAEEKLLKIEDLIASGLEAEPV